jgi:hypothetical protein
MGTPDDKAHQDPQHNPQPPPNPAERMQMQPKPKETNPTDYPKTQKSETVKKH